MANEIKIHVNANTKNAESRLASISQRLAGVGRAATIAGGAILAIGVGSVTTFAKMGDEVHKMAIRTGFSTEMLSGLRVAADLSGSSLQGMEKGVGRMQRTILDAGRGLSTATDSLARMGVSLDDLKGKTEEEKFHIMLMGLAGIEDKGAKAATAMEVFGRAGTGMLPMLTEGSEGLKELLGKAAELGVEFDQESSQSAADFTDSLTKLKASMQGVMMEIGGQLAPILTELATKVSEVISRVSAWMDANPQLARILVIVTGAIGAVLAVLGPMLIMLPGIVIAIKAVIAAFAILTGPIGLVIAAVVAFALAWKNNFLGIQDITKKIFEAVAGFIGTAIDWIVDKINALITAVNSVSKFFNIAAIPPLEKMGDKLLQLGGRIKDVASQFLGLGAASNKAKEEIEHDATDLSTLSALPPTLGAGTGFATPAVAGGVTTGKGFLTGMSEDMINAFYKSATGKAALEASNLRWQRGMDFIAGHASGLSPEQIDQAFTFINLNVEVDNLGNAIIGYTGNQWAENDALTTG